MKFSCCLRDILKKLNFEDSIENSDKILKDILILTVNKRIMNGGVYMIVTNNSEIVVEFKLYFEKLEYLTVKHIYNKRNPRIYICTDQHEFYIFNITNKMITNLIDSYFSIFGEFFKGPIKFSTDIIKRMNPLIQFDDLRERPTDHYDKFDFVKTFIKNKLESEQVTILNKSTYIENDYGSNQFTLEYKNNTNTDLSITVESVNSQIRIYINSICVKLFEESSILKMYELYSEFSSINM